MKCKSLMLIVAVVLCGVLLWPPTQPAHALGQRQVVTYIRAIAADLELTPTQVENLTKQQAFNYLMTNYPTLSAARIKEFARYWPGIKGMLHGDAVERQTQGRFVLLRQQLKSVYPDAVGLQTEYARDIAMQLLPLLYGEVDPNAL